ncbi:pumilio homolog 3-like [Tubulanus polymorphus]|uniref:pumilio homolog 3-like n=1 Tax=Tubulanus polymorphus TaxID=672921 RepID=UPI003DA3CAA7
MNSSPKKVKKNASVRLTPEGASTKKKEIKRLKNDSDERKEIKAKRKKLKLENDRESPVKTKKDAVRQDPDGESTTEDVKLKEKKKKKPLQNLKDASKKVKSFATKKAVKRKNENEEGTEAKKPKLVEMKKKDRREIRKKSEQDNYDLSKRIKKIWEQIRKHDISKAQQEKLCTELYNLCKGKIKEIIFAHDTTRVIQDLFKYGTTEHKALVFEEIKDHFLEMVKSKYAKFCVRKIMKYGNKEQKNHVFKAFHGNIRKLIRHSEASDIIEFCYNQYANAQQRSSMVEEFYGPSFALFKTSEVRTLEKLMDAEPLKKDSILGNMKATLEPCIDKNIVSQTLVHRVFLEFFTYCYPKQRTTMIEALRESLVHMLHTRDGAMVAMTCLWYGTKKDRKLIIKSLKTHVVKICKEEYGHLLLLAIFDVVDDTVLIKKAILDEMLKAVSEVAFDQYGRKVLCYLLNSRDPLHFHPDIIKCLAKGDNNETSKKDPTARKSELLAAVSPALIQFVADNVKNIVMNNSSILLLMSILTHATGDMTETMKALVQCVAEPFETKGTESHHIIEHPAGHITLKRIIAHDKSRKEAKNEVLFSRILVDNLPAGAMKSWIVCNRGCFVLVNLLELADKHVTTAVQNEILPEKKSLKKLNFKGAQILFSKLT